MRVKVSTANNIILLVLGVVLFLVNMLIGYSAWHAYFFMIALGGLVYTSYQPASPFYPPLMLYLWFSVFNLKTILLLHIGQDDGATYFTYVFLPQAWHYQAMIQEQFHFALPMLLISIFISWKTVTPKATMSLYSFSKQYWYIFYAIGVCAIAFLILKGGGLSAAVLSRKARVVGSGWAVVAQYLLIVGVGLFVLKQKHKSMYYHLVMTAVLCIPAALTHERSLIMAPMFGVLAYHSIFTKKLKNRHFVYLVPLLAFAVLAMGLSRAYLMMSAAEADRGFFEALTKDATFGTGYLIFRERGIDYDASLKSLILSFSFISSFIKMLFGSMPIAPNTAFSEAMFPVAATTTTFSMGLLGEAHYMFSEYRILYYLGVGIFVHWLSDYMAKGDPLMLIFIAGFIFRVAKGGIAGGLAAVWIMVILLLIVRLIDFIFTLQKTKNVLRTNRPPAPPEV